MKHRTKSHENDPEVEIGSVTLGDVAFPIYRGLITTLDRTIKRKPEELRQAARAILGFETRTVCDMDLVGGAVQLEWYRSQGQPIPERVQQRHDNRLAIARQGEQT